MKSVEIREKFLKYFEKNKHTIVSSSKLIPEGDNTILFTNAGMNQFKNVFLGYDKRDYVRATTSQKCVRAGGKHNDLEQVGVTARHHTFFEMLGNFSFGDYFKKDAIRFAWDFLTNELKIPKQKLYVTVFETDDEAAEIWHQQEGVPKDRIFRLGEKDNFWRMGDTGPCGPCTEIFYDHGPSAGSTGNPNAKFGEDDQRFVEIWNLVFMQYFEESPGKLNPLPKPSVDTGAGLERIAAVMQGVYMNYDTDLFQPLIQKAAKISGKKYNSDKELDTAFRVIADHSRAAAFLIADGVMPTNDGRGYVLRRILRRGIRFGRKLSLDQSILTPVVEELISVMGKAYPELTQQKNLILKTVKSEEESFLKTLDQGTEIFNKEIAKLKKDKKNTLPGEFAFKLYDTYGFPADLTRLMSDEQNIQFDEAGFEKNMDEARKRSQASWKGQALAVDQGHLIAHSQKIKATEFVGYSSLSADGKVLALSDGQKIVEKLGATDGLLVTDKTPFYAEGGGQVGDVGHGKSSKAKFEVTNCIKIGNAFFHSITITEGELKTGDSVHLEVSSSTRRETQSNHSATHLMHAALRTVLGTHVTQAGSHVDSNRTRFDFTHDKPVTDEEIAKIEELVNEQIGLAHDIKPEVMPYKKAIDAGVMALFGEKYGDEVRVLKMGDFSAELCGGTHVSNTAQIRLFKISSETGIAKGVRRIEAVTGTKAISYLQNIEKIYDEVRASLKIDESFADVANIQNGSDSKTVSKLQNVISEKDAAVKEAKKIFMESLSKNYDVDKIASTGKKFSDGTYVFVKIDTDDRKFITDFSEKLRNKIQSGIVLAVGEGSEGCPVIVSVTKNLTTKYNAGKILQEVNQILGGKGGGKPDLAQGSAPTLSALDQAKKKMDSLIQ
ncbi:MAG: alanine--tRNA ligase [Bdellovibrionota bacterium]